MEILKNKQNFFTAIFLAILLLGAFLRLYNLSATSFTADEFLGVNTAYGYLKTGEWRRWDFNLGKVADDKPYAHSLFDLSSSDDAAIGAYTRAWMFNWQIAQFLKIFPVGAESSFRIVSVLWGIVSIFAIYFVTKLFTGKKEIGLLAAFLFVISVSAIVFDRKVRMYSMFLPVYLAFSYFLYQFIENEKNLKYVFIKKLRSLTGLNFSYFIPLAIFGLLSLHLQLLAANIFIVLLVYLVIQAFTIYRKDGMLMNRYAKYVLLLALFFFLVFFFAPDLVAPFLSSFQLNNHYSYVSKVLSDYSNGILAIAAMVFGMIYLWKNAQKEGLFISVSFLVTLILAIFFWDRSPGDQYIFFVKSFQIILIASGIYYLADFFDRNFVGKKMATWTVSLAALLILLPNYAYFFQENNVYAQTSKSEEPNYRKVFTYFQKNKKDGNILVTRWFRNYYFSGSDVKLITFGGERSSQEEKKITAQRLESIQKDNPCGWFIWSESDDDYITGDAKDYARKNFEQINDIQVRGPITVNRWCNE